MKNVYDATIDRLKVIFEDFDNVLVAFSCGKDSGVMLNMAYQYAKENGNINYDTSYRDWETDRKSTRLNSSHRSLSRMPSSA